MGAAWVSAGMMGALGLCLGSFSNVLVWRFPRREDFIFLPSHCPSCFRPIAWYENIPVLSWLALGGRCSSCRCAISAQYPLVESGFGLLFFFMAAKFGFDLSSIFFLGFFSVLFLIALLDIKTFKVYDVMTFPLLLAGAWSSVMFPGLYSFRAESLAGILVVGGVTFLLAWVGKKIFGREALGAGDIKLMAAAGGFLGWNHGLCSLMDAALASSLVSVFLVWRGFKLKDALPFAPFLVMGCFGEGIDLLAGNKVPTVTTLLFYP